MDSVVDRDHPLVISIVNRPNLDTLTTAIDITREAWRNYITGILQRPAVLEVIHACFAQNPGRSDLEAIKARADEVEKQQRSVRDIVDISCGHYIMPELVRQHVADNIYVEFTKALKDIRPIREFRNEVCHPPCDDIPRDELIPKLRRIREFLESINSSKQFVKAITSLELSSRLLSQDPVEETKSKLKTAKRTRQKAEAQVQKQQGTVEERDRALERAKAQIAEEKRTRQEAEAQVRHQHGIAKGLDQALEKAQAQTQEMLKTRLVRILLLPLAVAIGLVSVMALAIFQPGHFQQLLVATTSGVSSLGISVPVYIFGPAEAFVPEIEFASLAADLQKTEEKLATAQSELESKAQIEAALAKTSAELESTRSVLMTVEAEVAAKNIELEELATELAEVQVEQTDTAASEANEKSAITDISAPTLITATRSRTGPGEEFEVAGILPEDASVQLTGIDASGQWYLLSSANWIPVANVSGRIPEALPVATLASVLVNANLRQEPTTNSSILGTVLAGQTVVLIGQQEGSQPAGTWYLLASGYWIYGDLVVESPAFQP